MTTLFKISAIADVYADAYLADDSGNLLFLSVWGRDTALQELIARLQLPRSENGIREFNIIGNYTKYLVSVPNVDDLDKISLGVSQTIFGKLTQLWIYTKLAILPDLVNHRGLMLHADDQTDIDEWPLFKMVCPMPMLDEWREVFLNRCHKKQWIKPLTNGVGVAGTLIELDDELEPLITNMINEGELTLPNSI
ncbi:MAG: hypothetical protein ABW104_18020 [Candidatus Thiodiazotropha sp. 6PLUC2]|nr:hypothetical protein [Candidatus Thiodiazotropha lotti]MCW4218808.1 hypothetical protein [Candidatus Thiodiazotropha lotti]